MAPRDIWMRRPQSPLQIILPGMLEKRIVKGESRRHIFKRDHRPGDLGAAALSLGKGVER